jgi:UDP-N-acetylglucosamine 4,6-dehydratase/5-epimerase
MKELIEGKTVLVTGGTGSIGSEIVRQLLDWNPKVVRVLSRTEHMQYSLMQELGQRPNLVCFIGDVRNAERLNRATVAADLIFHVAAMKHVPICEFNPFEAIETNVIGAQNVVNAAISNRVKHVVAISTDKAVSPMNVMGGTKLLAEKLFTSAHHYSGVSGTKFSCVRFGNVLGSRGSVLPAWINQIAQGQPVTLTDPEMTRFFLSIPQAVNLVFKAMRRMQGGEIFILKMPVLRMGDLADEVIKRFASAYGRTPESIEQKVIGVRPGEKMYELLMSEDEAAISLEVDDMFIIPPHISIPNRPKFDRHYEGEKITPRTGYDSRRDLPMGPRSIQEMLRQTFPEDRPLHEASGVAPMTNPAARADAHR